MEVNAEYIKSHMDSIKLIDVRTPQEYADGHIPGAINIPYSASPCTADTVAEETATAYEAQGLTKQSPLVLYCRTGARAQAAAEILQQAGFTDVKVYTGSWTDWMKNSSNPVQTGTAP